LIDKAIRLYPLPPREVPAESIYEDLELPPAGWSDASRPYVVINMVSSVDGKSTIGGKAGHLGSETDRQTMRNLRSRADAVMVGAGTLRAEKLSLGIDEPEDKPQPLAIIATTTGDLPLQRNLILGEEQEVLVLSPKEPPHDPAGYARHLQVPEDPSRGVDLEEALKMLKSEHRVETLLVEGGPTLNHALISRSLSNELFLTLAPMLLGSEHAEAPTILNGELQHPSPLSLLSVHLAGDELLLRYALHPTE
jgi:2,5-diamino-6-(ribosylamino)-4(3H)-pyrimidinone 5'-phosphate reductase